MQDLVTPDMLEAANALANTQIEKKVEVVPQESKRKVRVKKAVQQKKPVAAKKNKTAGKQIQPLKGTKEITPNLVYYRPTSPVTRGFQRLIYISAVLNAIGSFTANRKAFSPDLFIKFYSNDKVMNDCVDTDIFEHTKDKRVRLSKDGWEYLHSQMTGSDIALREHKPKMEKLTENMKEGAEGFIKV